MSVTLEDPMIAWSWRNIDRTIFLVIVISLVSFVGFFSRKSQTALALTVATTALIFFLLMVTRNEFGFAF